MKIKLHAAEIFPLRQSFQRAVDNCQNTDQSNPGLAEGMARGIKVLFSVSVGSIRINNVPWGTSTIRTDIKYRTKLHCRVLGVHYVGPRYFTLPKGPNNIGWYTWI